MTLAETQRLTIVLRAKQMELSRLLRNRAPDQEAAMHGFDPATDGSEKISLPSPSNERLV
jgi:hypothetical protein